MFRKILTRFGVPAAVAAVLLIGGPAWAQRGGGGHGGGFHSGGFHSGGIHSGGIHSGGIHSGGIHSGGFRSGGFRSNNFHRGNFPRGGFLPGYYYGGYPYYGDYPSYDYGSAPDLGYDDYGVEPWYSGGYQPPPPVNPDTTSAQADTTAHVTVRAPADATLWFEGTEMMSMGTVREFESPPLEPGNYTYEIRARWTENGRDITQTQKVAVSPGVHTTVNFPIPSGTE